MLNLGWVDFSKSDRDMVMSVLRQLTEPTCLAQMKRQILLKRRSQKIVPLQLTKKQQLCCFFPFPVPGGESAATCPTEDQPRVAVDFLIRLASHISLWPVLNQKLRLLPQFPRYNRRDKIFMTVLFFGRGKFESLVDIVGFGFVVDQRTRVDFILEDVFDRCIDTYLFSAGFGGRYNSSFLNKSSISIGFPIWSFIPADKHFSISSLNTFAVIAIMGIALILS